MHVFSALKKRAGWMWSLEAYFDRKVYYPQLVPPCTGMTYAAVNNENIAMQTTSRPVIQIISTGDLRTTSCTSNTNLYVFINCLAATGQVMLSYVVN